MLAETVMQDVPVFALADYALLPYTVAALQVFEPSHREMIDDAQASNQLLVVAGLEPGWTGTGPPPVLDVAGLGKVVNARVMDDGSRDVFLHGIARVRILGMLRETPYRTARIERLDDQAARGERWRLGAALRRLQNHLNALIRTGGVGEDVSRVIANSDDPAILSYRLGALLLEDPDSRQRFLEMRSTLARVEVLTDALGGLLMGAERRTPVGGRTTPTDPALRLN